MIFMKEMNILSINDQDFEVVDAAGRSGLSDLDAIIGGGSIVDSASCDNRNNEIIEVDAAAAPFHYCVILYPPLQGGSINVDPSPDYRKPFISCNQINVEVYSENLFKFDDCVQGYYLDDQGNLVEQSFAVISDYMTVGGTGSITYGVITGSGSYYCAWYDASKNFVSSFKLQNGTTTQTVPSGAYYLRISCAKDDAENLFVTFSHEGHYYVSLGSSVYHFTLDVLTGRLLKPDIYCTLKDQQDLDFTMTTSANYTTFSVDITDYFPTVKAEGFAKIFCDCFKGYNSETTDTNAIFIEDGVLKIRVEPDLWTTEAEFLAWVRNNGINFLAELETPDVVIRTKKIPKTISGKNTIKADKGILDIVYYKNSSLVRDFITLINDLQ